MSKTLLGQILASVALAAVAAGEIAINPGGTATNTDEIDQIVGGFFHIWVKNTAPKQV